MFSFFVRLLSVCLFVSYFQPFEVQLQELVSQEKKMYTLEVDIDYTFSKSIHQENSQEDHKTSLIHVCLLQYVDTSLLAGSNSTALNKVTKPIFDQLFACELNSHEISCTISKVDSKHCTVHIPWMFTKVADCQALRKILIMSIQ